MDIGHVWFRFVVVLIIGTSLLTARADDKLTIKKLRTLEFQLVSARKSLHAYRVFLHQPNVSQQDREIAEARIRDLEPLAEQGGWLVGGKKLTPQLIETNRAKAESLIAEAIKLAEAKSNTDAQRKMEEAAKADRTTYQADFLMGLHAVTVTKDFQVARLHFEDCVERGRILRSVSGPVAETNLIHALNNLALLKIRDDKLEEAHRIWTEILDIRPNTPPQVPQNIGRTFAYMQKAKGGPVLKVSDATLKKYAELVGRLGSSGTPVSAGNGWIFLGYIAPKATSQTQAVPPRIDNAQFVGSGTGVIVHPGYILTCSCVVRDEKANVDLVRIRCGGTTSDAGKIVAVDEHNQLVLIQDPTFRTGDVGLVQDIKNHKGTTRLAGFSFNPTTRASELNANECVVSVLPVGTHSDLILDCDQASASNGSVVLDEQGNVVGMLVGGAGMKVAASADVTSADIMLEFLKKNIPNYVGKPRDVKFDPSNFSSEFGQRIVQIEAFVNPSAPPRITTADKSLAVLFAPVAYDHACLMCDGQSKVGCPAKNCQNGAVAVDSSFNIRDPITGGVKVVPTKNQKPCATCRGSGLVDCPACTNGTDSFR